MHEPPTRKLAIDSILHPTDFSESSQLAFAHALKLALLGRARLTILNASKDSVRHGTRWRDFPAVRATLERWGLLPAGSSRASVSKLGISVEKISAHEEDVVQAILGYARSHPAQLLVLATHGRRGASRWLHRSVAEPLARRTRIMTLFVPQGARGFVADQDGDPRLDRVLIPINRSPRPQPAVTVAAAFARALASEKVRFALLHAGSGRDGPAVRLPDDAAWSWERLRPTGRPVAEIVRAARSLQPDLIVMTTRGRNGGLRPSTTERVLRRTSCPLLAIPEA